MGIIHRPEIEEVLGPAGRIARRLPNHEYRPQQLEMATAVARALDDPHHLAVEAGTGVGKTFAYLVPVIQRIARTGQRVVVSTHTIALQEQLLGKDIPLLNAVLPDEFTAILMKGRNNYVGLRRLAQTAQRQDLLFDTDSKRQEIRHLREWTQTTADGSLSDLAPMPDYQVWDLVKSEHGNCMGHRCRFYKDCFYQQARRRAQNAQLLIVNHALFFTDLALRRHGVGIIPDYDFAVLDEAHTVREVAAAHFGMTISEQQIRFLLNTLFDHRTERGFLTACHAESAIECVNTCRRSSDQVFTDLFHWQQDAGRSNGRCTSPPPVANALSPALRKLHFRLSQIRHQLSREEDLFELSSLMDRCESLAGLLEECLEQQRENHVYWIESNGQRHRRVTLQARPLDVSDDLSETLFGTTPAVILTSATLTTNSDDGFEYFRANIGLKDSRCLELDSPFDFNKQVQLHIESALPPPTEAHVFVPQAADVLESYVQQTQGRTLALFTSYNMMAEFKERLHDRLADAGLTLLVQNDGIDRTTMLKHLREHPRTVLFGTDSFWEGVDVQGDALQSVIIVRLPFGSPERPVCEARIEKINSSGGDAFLEYQLPEAVLRFKQGVGRLIRSNRDQGIVVVLDSRLCKRAYGRYFLASFPDCEPIIHD